MYIKRINIKNFKSFKETFSLELSQGLNILVGNNETGKSTVLEAIHLVLTGICNGRYFKNELSDYFFNYESVQEYLESLTTKKPLLPPEITIELFIAGDDLPFFEGDGNSTKISECGICFKASLNEKFREEYNDYIHEGNITSLPIEFYEVGWTTCARDPITPRKIPIKSALIDSSSNRYKNGSDVYISHIIKNHLSLKQRNELVHAHRRLQGNFISDSSVQEINKVIINMTKKTSADKEVKLSIDLTSQDAWESAFLTSVENIPFHHIGKGEQSIIKTKLALEHKKSKEANMILIEEPENHLSHSKLNQLIREIQDKCEEKQILMSTHSSFVANKLGLKNLIILENKQATKLSALPGDTQEFFEKIPGYDTLRMILCRKAILVEGDCDELLVQRAYMDVNGKLPIENGIDVISVGTSFLRFLQIAEKIKKDVRVVTDTDGDIKALELKYEDYLGNNQKNNIKICYSKTIDDGPLNTKEEKFNYNTLEPKFFKVNGNQVLNTILGTGNKTDEQLHLYMRANKTKCALRIFKTEEPLKFPNYILEAINE